MINERKVLSDRYDSNRFYGQALFTSHQKLLFYFSFKFVCLLRRASLNVMIKMCMTYMYRNVIGNQFTVYLSRKSKVSKINWKFKKINLLETNQNFLFEKDGQYAQ
jgi:hypothetical protein